MLAKRDNMTEEGRYLLFVDILGFREFVRTNSVEAVYEKLNACLRAHHEWERLNDAFRTLYFSDTIIFWQKNAGYKRRHFLDMCSVSATIFCSLVGQNIPIRGAVAFGRFVVERDSADRHDVFFGDALVEAYDAQSAEQWLGISICESAWRPYEAEKPNLDSLCQERIVLRRTCGGTLLVNPFRHIHARYTAAAVKNPDVDTDDPEIRNELHALRFLDWQADGFAQRGDYSSRSAVKYFTTLRFTEDCLCEGGLRWARSLISGLGDDKSGQYSNSICNWG